MIVVADTSPLNYLILIDQADLLLSLFGEVLLPHAVHRELQHPKTPERVRQWIAKAPEWLRVRGIQTTPSAPLLILDVGEREAIQLAVEVSADAVLMDDAEGRSVAESFGLRVSGTLGILERASRLGMIDLRQAFAKLEQTNFRISPELREALIRRNSLAN
jgi:predicted nucleic acid-binding protein